MELPHAISYPSWARSADMDTLGLAPEQLVQLGFPQDMGTNVPLTQGDSKAAKFPNWLQCKPCQCRCIGAEEVH